MQCKSLWIKASAKCINVNVNVMQFYSARNLNISVLQCKLAKIFFFLLFQDLKKKSLLYFIILFLRSVLAVVQFCSRGENC